MNIKQIRAALAAATPGPWRHDPTKERREGASGCGSWPKRSEGVFSPDNMMTIAVTGPSDDKQSMADAHLIANAPTWLAALCDEIERRDALLRRYEDSHAIGLRNRGVGGQMITGCNCDLCAEARKMLEAGE
jgi:hypothetical protein